MRLPSRVVVPLAIVLATVGILRALGRVFWCKCGTASLASWDIWSLHNSQHVIDPYTFSHVLHGLLFYAALRLVPGTSRPGLRFTLAIAIEAIWEILENTPMMIARYREATISLDYFGDSIVNSVADIGACAVGYLLARTIPARASIAIFITVEISMILWIRDSLLLNVLMLVWPLEAIRNWQMS